MPIDPNNLSGTAVMTFDDEFNTLSLWNGTSGTWTTTYPFADPAGNGSTLAGNGEQEWYVNSNYAPTASVTPWTVANGDLHLTAAPAAASIQPLINGYQYTSGQLNTVHSFSQTYGYFEMRAELPAGQGMWPAFWLLPQNGAWPPELDVMEVLGNSPTTLYTTVHTASTGTNTQQGVATTTPDTSKGFHTYAVDWEPDYITWYFDGKAIDRVATPSDMNSPMYMLLNLAVGGSWPGDVNATTPFPADMSVDWVHAYRSLPGGAAALSPSTAVPATGTGDVLSAAGAPVALTAGGAATSAAMLSTGAIVVGGAKTLASGGGFSGIADLYSTSGAQSGGDVALTGWAGAQSGMSPQVTALPGGFWEVTYTGAGAPAGSEIYNASGTLTFLDNAFTTGSPVFTTLPDGSWVEASSNAPGRFEIVQASGQTTWLALPTVGGAQPTPSAAITLGDGGFAFSYAGSTELDRYSANAGIHTTMQLASTPVSTALGVAGFTDGVTEAAWLAAGANGTTSLRLESFGPLGQVQAAAVTLAASVDATTEIRMLGTGVHDQSLVLWSTGGTVYGAAFDGTTASAATALAPGALDGVQSAVLTDGDVALSWLESDNGVQHLWAEVVDPSTMQATRQDLGAADGSARLVALQGGGFAESWHAGGAIEGVVYDGLGHYGAAVDVSGDFAGVNSQGQLLAVGTGGSGPATLQAYSLGGGTSTPTTPPASTPSSPSTAVPATGSGDVLSATGAPLALAAGGAATSAAMLSTGAIVAGGAETLLNGAGFSGIADLYSASGAQAGGDVALTGWVGAQSVMSPQVTALPGGFWEVTYAGAGAPAGSEIYNASGTLTFLDNAFTTGSPVFTTLPDGSWVEASSNAPGRFEIVQASGQTTWLALPTVGGAQPTPSAAITLGDGGFVFSYAGSSELDRYSANGGIHTTMQLAVAPTTPALGVAGFTDGVTEAAWLAAGANGTTSLRLESFGPLGQVQAAAVTLAASVDATTEIRMLGTGVHDQSLVLWSTGGTVYGAAFDGTTASAATALAPGALDGVQSAVLTDGDIALSWLERDNGVQHLWAEVVDPSTMQATRQDLGAADGSARLVALQGGGFAESWHAGGAIEGVVYDGLGHYGAAVDVSGDFVGVNSQGQLLAVGTGGSGPASLQAYSLGDGTAAPSVSIASAGGLTNQLAQTVSGTAAAGTTVTLYEDTSATGAFATKAGSATVGADGTWSIGVTFSGDGAHYVEALDQAPSGATAASAPVGYTLDTTAPAVSLRLVSDTGVSSSDAITSSPALSGTGDPNAVVHFTIDGMSLSATASADASGTWSFLPTGLADGRHVVVASETDAAGNAGSSSLDFTLDTHPAAAAFGNFTETAVKGGYKLTLTGTASDAASSVQTVSIYEDGHPIGTVHPANGLWSFTDPLVTNAVHKFTLTTLDAAGNTGPGVQTLILGHSGANTLTGVAGAAVIYGGAGADTLTGAPGTNTYVYHAASDAPLPKGWLSPIETITNFHEATDRIDLSALGPLAYGGETKAMTAHHIDWYVAGGNTYVSVDVTGDRHPDMLIELNGLHTLSSADFIHG